MFDYAYYSTMDGTQDQGFTVSQLYPSDLTILALVHKKNYTELETNVITKHLRI